MTLTVREEMFLATAICSAKGIRYVWRKLPAAKETSQVFSDFNTGYLRSCLEEVHLPVENYCKVELIQVQLCRFMLKHCVRQFLSGSFPQSPKDQ